MIEWLTLRNFRSWGHLPQLDLKPITIIFGPNSSGKTALLQALLMLKQTAESNDRSLSIRYGGPYVDLGSFADSVHDHDEARPLGVGLRWRPEQLSRLRELDEEGPEVTADSFEYRAEWTRTEDVSLSTLAYSTDALQFQLSRAQGGRYRPRLTSEVPIVKRRRVGKPWPLPGPESCYALPRQVARDWPHVDLLEFNHQFELLMDRIHYVGPMREYPQRFYLWTGEAPGVVLPDGAGAIEALVADTRAAPKGPRAAKRARDCGLVAQAARWLRQFGLADDFQIRPIAEGARQYEVWVQVPGSKVATLLPDVGFGVSQVLPVIVQLHFAPPGSVLLFEQPELHLHPRAAACLADLLLGVAHERRLQVVVETHSEYLLARLQRRMAEADTPEAFAHPDNIGMYFYELVDGKSRAVTVRLNIFGEIENWPPGFFGDTIGDLQAMTQRAVRRKLAQRAS
jgi:hypothetical protein